MSLRIITLQLRKNCQFARLKCHLSSAGINQISRRYVFQEQGYAVLAMDKQKYRPFFNVKQSRNILSRNYCTEKISSWNPVTYLENLEVQQLKADDYKKIVLDLVSHMYKSDHTACQNVFHTSTYRSVFFPIYPQKDYTSHCTDIIEYQEHICKLDVFRTFLETLANNFESIGIGDQLDIFGGLILLGINKTDRLMSQLFCQFSKPECVMSLSELAKLSAIYSYYSGRILQLTVIVPKVKSLLNANTIQHKEDLNNFSLLLKQGKYWIQQYPFIFEKCLQIILDGLNDADLYKDLDCICQVFSGVFSNCSRRSFVGNDFWKFSPLFLDVSTKLFRLIEPHIEHLTSHQIAEVFRNFRKNKVFIIKYSIPNIFTSFTFRLTQHSLKLLRGDLPNEEKLYCIEGIVNHIPESEEENILQIISEIIPDADIQTLHQLHMVMPHTGIYQQHYNIHALLIQQMSQVLISIRDQLLKQWHANTSSDMLLTLDIVKYLAFCSMSLGFKNLLPELTPYITQTLNSGYGCFNSTFSVACGLLIQILGSNISPIAETKIRDMILSMKDKKNIGHIIFGAKSVFTTDKDRQSKAKASEIIRLAETAIRDKTLSLTELYQLNLSIKRYDKGTLKSGYMDLAKEVAIKLEAFQMNRSVFYHLLTNAEELVVTENNANRMLEYYMDQFDSDLVKSVPPMKALLDILFLFIRLNRLPRKRDKLEELSELTFDMYYHDMPLDYSYKILRLLISCQIYLDEHIRKVFSIEYMERLDAILQSKDEKTAVPKKEAILDAFGKLNAEVVILRPDLNIPWICDDLVERKYLEPKDLLKPRVNKEFVLCLANLLGGFEFFKDRAVTEYGKTVDFEFYLNSDNVPVVYETAKKMDISGTGIQKVALYFERMRRFEYLANDPYCISLCAAHEIRILEALGYRVIYIPSYEWKTEYFATRSIEFKANYLGRKIFG